jgi:hypothetical protein
MVYEFMVIGIDIYIYEATTFNVRYHHGDTTMNTTVAGRRSIRYYEF